MPGLKGFVRVKDLDPRARRNAALLARKFENLVLADPLGLDSDGRFTVELGNGVEVSSGVLVASAGMNVAVDADGINALPSPAWFFSGSGVQAAKTEALALAAATAASLAASVDARSRAFTWFMGS